MERNQVVALLALAARVDHRVPDEDMIDAWVDAAIRARWTVDAAEEAIRAHQTESTAYLVPAHITERIKAASIQPLLFGHDRSQQVVKLATPLHVARCKAWVKADVLRKRAKKHPNSDVVRYAETAKVELFAIASPEFLRTMNSEHWARELEHSPDYDPNRHVDVGEVDPQQAFTEMTGWLDGEPINPSKPPPPPNEPVDLDPLGVECPHCKAAIAFFCVGHRGARLTHTTYHDSRIQAAKAKT